MTSNVDLVCDESFSIAGYWSTKTVMWPKLAHIAHGLLGITAASTPSERAFSLAGCTIEERRTQLSPNTVDGLLFLHGLSNK